MGSDSSPRPETAMGGAVRTWSGLYWERALGQECSPRHRRAWGRRGAMESWNSFSSTFSSPASTSCWVNPSRRQRTRWPDPWKSVSWVSEECKTSWRMGLEGLWRIISSAIYLDFTLQQLSHQILTWLLAAHTHVLWKFWQSDEFSLPVALAEALEVLPPWFPWVLSLSMNQALSPAC